MGIAGGTFEVQVRTVPQRVVAVISREVYQPELDAYIEEGFTALFDFAAKQPGLRDATTTPEWPTYAVYHGPVSPRVRAVVELCAVVGAAAKPADGIQIRVEPAHDEAYVNVTKTQLDYPQILDAYEAVATWVAERGHLAEALPPREVYLTDVRLAAPDDHVCDVALPFEPKP